MYYSYINAKYFLRKPVIENVSFVGRYYVEQSDRHLNGGVVLTCFTDGDITRGVPICNHEKHFTQWLNSTKHN